ncbi:isocitrate/isopropylmalate dehydrogenase family protein [Pelagibius sp. Alg239-R121]|uniref:isocitrate/isopropylmalate dehydrogenase family protein n=1 Tax=Pelagibius sp. Alg239-R121 TaxID=2993448 RepID=UPI0024A6A627|nr:isocitrate/isopropylmalate dehydrogenase family protein [Pelagibius sp. Alg239-R121]
MPEKSILVLPGDGIGPEIARATSEVVKASAEVFGLDLSLHSMNIGFTALADHGTTLPQSVIDAAQEADGVILGPVSHNAYPPLAEGGVNPSGILRTALDLFANIRPARSRPGVPTPIANPIDLIIVRENLEGFYADRNMHLGPGEFMPTPDTALAIRRVTVTASRRIAEQAFSIAAQRPGQRVAAIHKANVMRVSDGLFLREVRRVAENYPEIAYEEILVDAAAALLVRDPSRFDVIVTTNMFGDILSDLASELSGGLGLAASLNAGPTHAAAQAQHGSAPDLAGKDSANPVSLIGSAAMLLDHLGFNDAASAIETACEAALADPASRTADLGGALGTSAFAKLIADRIKEGHS